MHAWRFHTILKFIVPAPDVTIIANNRVGELYIGSDLSLQCHVQVNATVRDSVMIKYLWNVNGRTQDQLPTNQSSLIYSPLRMSNNGVYCCKVTLSPVDASHAQDQYITNGEKMAEIMIDTIGNNIIIL